MKVGVGFVIWIIFLSGSFVLASLSGEIPSLPFSLGIYSYDRIFQSPDDFKLEFELIYDLDHVSESFSKHVWSLLTKANRNLCIFKSQRFYGNVIRVELGGVLYNVMILN